MGAINFRLESRVGSCYDWTHHLVTQVEFDRRIIIILPTHHHCFHHSHGSLIPRRTLHTVVKRTQPSADVVWRRCARILRRRSVRRGCMMCTNGASRNFAVRRTSVRATKARSAFIRWRCHFNQEMDATRRRSASMMRQARRHSIIIL